MTCKHNMTLTQFTKDEDGFMRAHIECSKCDWHRWFVPEYNHDIGVVEFEHLGGPK